MVEPGYRFGMAHVIQEPVARSDETLVPLLKKHATKKMYRAPLQQVILKSLLAEFQEATYGHTHSEQIDSHVQQGCGDNKLQWICCLDCARQHIASAFREAVKYTLPWIHLVCIQTRRDSINPWLRRICAHLSAIYNLRPAKPSLWTSCPVLCPSGCFGLWTSLCCARTFAGTSQRIDEPARRARGWAHLRVASEDVPAILARAEGPQWTSPPSRMKTTLSSTCVGMRSKRKRPRQRGDGEADDAKDEDVDWQEGAEDTDDDGAGEFMGAMPEPCVEAEATPAAGAAVPSWPTRKKSRFLALHIVYGSASSRDLAAAKQWRERSCVRRCTYSADEPKSHCAREGILVFQIIAPFTNSFKSSSHLLAGLPALLWVFVEMMSPGFHWAAFLVHLSWVCVANRRAWRHFKEGPERKRKGQGQTLTAAGWPRPHGKSGLGSAVLSAAPPLSWSPRRRR